MKELISAKEVRSVYKVQYLETKFSRRWNRVCPMINENILRNAKEGNTSAKVLTITELNPSFAEDNVAFAEFVQNKLEKRGYKVSLIFSGDLLVISVYADWGEEEDE